MLLDLNQGKKGASESARTRKEIMRAIVYEHVNETDFFSMLFFVPYETQKA
ncbi:MAG: hypothetical protein IPH35_20210 [Rhodoferax sp.]|nr:hypothetical protein [Rhodoferax sp.]